MSPGLCWRQKALARPRSSAGQEGSGAAPVFVVPYNHFAVELLLLLLERVLHLLPLQASIPREESDAVRGNLSRGCSEQLCLHLPLPGPLRTNCPQGQSCSHLAVPGAPPWPHTVPSGV